MSSPSTPKSPLTTDNDTADGLDDCKIEALSKRMLSLKIGMLGDAQVGKTTLMVKYVKSKFDMTYIETFGLNTMDKVINLNNVDIKLSIWELGGQREFTSLMPLVCCDAKAILFIFDLTQKPSLISIKTWYKQSRRENKSYQAFLVGTKFDLFQQQENSYKLDVSSTARKYAKKMCAPLIYCSSAQSINIRKIFKLIVAKLLYLNPKIKEQIDETKDALIEFSNVEHKNKLKNRASQPPPSRLHRKRASTVDHKYDHTKMYNKNTSSHDSGDDTNDDEVEHRQDKQQRKAIQKRLKRIKSRLDFLVNDEEKVKQIEIILGIGK